MVNMGAEFLVPTGSHKCLLVLEQHEILVVLPKHVAARVVPLAGKCLRHVKHSVECKTSKQVPPIVGRRFAAAAASGHHGGVLMLFADRKGPLLLLGATKVLGHISSPLRALPHCRQSDSS